MRSRYGTDYSVWSSDRSGRSSDRDFYDDDSRSSWNRGRYDNDWNRGRYDNDWNRRTMDRDSDWNYGSRNYGGYDPYRNSSYRGSSSSDRDYGTSGSSGSSGYSGQSGTGSSSSSSGSRSSNSGSSGSSR